MITRQPQFGEAGTPPTVAVLTTDTLHMAASLAALCHRVWVLDPDPEYPVFAVRRPS